MINGSHSAAGSSLRREQRIRPFHQPGDLVAHYRDRGLVGDGCISHLLATGGMQDPDRLALTQGSRQLSYAQMSGAVSRFAGYLDEHGIGPGAVVTWQAPNWWEAYVAALAIWHVGAVSSPIVGFYRENEVRHIVSELQPDAVICSGRVRDHSNAEMMTDILAEVGIAPKTRIVLRGKESGWTPATEVLGHPALLEPVLGGADDACLVLYTSGTTSKPKGVIHTSRTLLAETKQIRHGWAMGRHDVGYMPAPLAHVTGLLVGMTLPISVGGHLVLSDGWDAERAVREVAQHRVTYSAGATVFLEELAAASIEHRRAASCWRVYACGGAPVPRPVMEAAEERGIPAVRVYGMSELPTVTLGDSSLPFERRATTDGPVALGVEVRTIDGDGRFMKAGVPGELVVRGPERFAGYVDRAANIAILPGGWFRTGDIGTCDGDVTVIGRIKDIINRGGEKFSARGIEDVIVRHPLVRCAAVVPAPDQRLGEVPAAFLVPIETVEPAELCRYLIAAGLPKQKLPTMWFAMSELPTTASGKVKKNELIALLDPTRAGRNESHRLRCIRLG